MSDPRTGTPGSSSEPPPVHFAHLGEVPARWRAQSPDDPALITDDTIWSARMFADLVDAQVAALDALTPPGARVAVHATNSVAYVALAYAAPTAGRTLVPLNVRLADVAKVEQLDRAEVALLLGDPIAGHTGPHLALDDLAGRAPSTPARSLPVPDAHDCAWVIFTSGSTGRPKGVEVTHASMAAAVTTTAAARPLADDEVYLFPFPLFHIAAYNVVHAHARRRPVVLLERFAAQRLLDAITDHRVTAVSLTATMLRMVLDALAEPGAPPPPATLRTIAYGAAPMPRTLLREAHRVLGCDFAQGYGMTELSGNAVFLGPDEHRRGLAGQTRFLDAAGYAGPGVRLRIVDDHGNQVPPGNRGEITVAAEQICGGYLDDPAATAATIRNGWLHTGDIGIRDDDGLLHVVDRAKDIIVTGGENVASREVEEALASHPDIAQVAVIGLADDHWGEAVTACVVLVDKPAPDRRTSPAQPADDGSYEAPRALADELAAHVTTRLASFKKPRRIFVFDVLPTNSASKIDKPELRRRLS